MKAPLPPLPQPPLPQRFLPPLLPGIGAHPMAMPVGVVLAFAGVLGAGSLPLEASGWMPCDGRALDKDEFDELFGVIGYTYSTTAGGQTFQIPNLQGVFVRGVDPSGDVDRDLAQRKSVSGQSYAGVGSIQASALQLHKHRLSAASATAAQSQVGEEAGTILVETTTDIVPYDTQSPLNTSEYETRPINVALNFIIRFVS